MLVSVLILYFFTKKLLQNEIEEELYSTEARVETILKSSNNTSFISPVIEVQLSEKIYDSYLKDTLIYDPSQNEMELFRELSTYKKIGTTTYKITIRALIIENENILIAIVISYIMMLLSTFIAFFYLQKKKNKELWNPFFKNLQQMKQFSLSSENEIKLVNSEIIEFTELNKEILTLTKKVQADYKNLKQFTEDVSHEMQTPLSIIQAKIENFFNGDQLNEDQFKNLTSIQKDILRLTQLNKKLTLLSKIDNNQFTTTEYINITNLLEEIINDFKDLTSAKIIFNKETNIIIKADAHLARILCTNLITNSIKYGVKDKEIQILAKKQSILVSNFGEKALQQSDKIFDRYYREASKIRSTGLGLTIVKKICDLHGFQIQYLFEDKHHIFKIDFNSSENPN
tara:strand:+ start:538 stop:1737 length:1200 start_codon:yes stop_codon:yes gene_type:complete